MQTRRSFLLALAGAGMVGVGGVVYWRLPREVAATGDPIIKYGEEDCARCRMVISDIKFAAAWRDATGDEQHFDDIGCMVLLNHDRDMGIDTQYWVHDYWQEHWVDAHSASYIRNSDIRSPMGYGVAANYAVDAPESMDWNGLQIAMRDVE